MSDEKRQKQTLSFANRRARSVQGVHQMARILDDVGTIFLDEDDTV
jgi:predicted transcriptional regulator